MRFRTIALLVVAVAVFAVPADAQAKPYLGGKFTKKTVKRFERDLAKVGIATYKPGKRRPLVRVRGRRSPIRLTAADARSAAIGAWSHTGMTGGQLNQAMGSARLTPQFALPAGALVAGWAKRARTPSGRLARRILGKQDWKHYERIVFPNVVTLLFSSDTALHLTSKPKKRKKAHRGQAATAAASVTGYAAGSRPCTAARNFVKNTVNDVFDLIGHVRTDRSAIERLFGRGFLADVVAGVGDVLSTTVNTALDATRTIVIGVTEIPVQVLTKAIAGVAATVSVAGQVANSLLPWSGKMRATPSPTEKGVGAGRAGAFTIDVTAPGSNRRWADWVVDCAETFKLHLPTFTPKNAEVTWDITQAPLGLIRTGGNSALLNDRGVAQLAFVTGTETAEEAKGERRLGFVEAIATVHRKDLDQLAEHIYDSLFDQLPDVVQKQAGRQINQIVKPMVNKLTASVDQVRDVKADTLLPVYYHQAKEEKPGAIDGSWWGTMVSTVFGGPPGQFTATLKSNGNPFSGQFSVQGASCGSSGAVSGTLQGNQVNFGVAFSKLTGSFDGVLNGDAMSGNWSTPDTNECDADHGTWSATRVK